MSPSHNLDYSPPPSRTFVDRSRQLEYQPNHHHHHHHHQTTESNRRPSTTNHPKDMPIQPDFTLPSSSGSRDQRLIRRSRSSPSPAQDYEDDASRDSHDLSINPRAFERESLVDHLLLSFDRFDDGFGFDTNGSDFFGGGVGGIGGGIGRDIPDDASIGASSQLTGFTRGRRSYSSGHNQYYSNNIHGASASSQQLGLYQQNSRTGGGRYGSVDFGDTETPGFGVTYGRNLNSRRGLSSAGQTSAYMVEEYDDAAPTPTVYGGPRDRSLTVNSQQATLSRKPSKQSMKSTKRYNSDSLQPEPSQIPPMPAFVSNSSTQPNSLQQSSNNNTAQKSKPGFFRRVFGGGISSPTPVNNNTGGSSSSSNNGGSGPGSSGANRAFSVGSPSTPNFNSTTSQQPTSSQSPSHLHQQHQQQQQQQPQNHQHHHHNPSTNQPTPPQAVRQKSSFFRRRKKSVSDAQSPPSVPPLPLNKAVEKLQVEHPESSPVSSLRAVMDPFLKSPGRSQFSDSQQILQPFSSTPHQDPETAYLQKDATIRKVVNNDPGSPKARPTFFSESTRARDSDYGKKYPKEAARPGTAAEEGDDSLGPLNDIPSRIISRPQTSPNAPSALLPPGSSAEPPPIPVRYRRSYDNFKIEPPSILVNRQSTSSSKDWDSTNELRSPTATDIEPFIRPILTARELEVFQQQEMKRRASENLQSSLDVSVGTISKSRDADSSWLATPTPLTATGSGSNTPTVTLQRDGENAELWADEFEDEKDDTLSEVVSHVLDEHDEPTEMEEEIAKKIYDGDDMYVLKERTPFLLTELSPSGARLRKAYMSLYDWSNVNILTALRQMCNRLVLKGETQEVDRIMVAISKRWCECNPNHGFKSADIIHTILYSLLLLNTDLHLAEIPSSQKMTRGQFIKNTMGTIRKELQDSSNELAGTLAARPAHHSIPVRHGSFPEESPSNSLNSVAPSPNAGSNSRDRLSDRRPSIDYGRGTRNSSKSSGIGNLGNLSPRFAPEGWNDKNYIDDGGVALVNKGIGGGIRVWETQVEIILKDFYASVKEHALPLHGAPVERYPEHSSTNLSVFGSGMLRRSPSTISKAPSEASLGGRRMDGGRLGSGWAAKNRSRQRVYNGSRAGSSRTSLEERSVWSPGASSTWSKLSLDKTQASTLSVNSLGSAFANDDYKQSIGFANALSHAIIREEASGTGEDHSTIIEDEDLELAGPPWAKEGLIKHKHHLEGIDKKAKNRAWTESFAVIEKGYMRLFQFSARSKAATLGQSGIVGGGNWTDSAEPIGTFLLRQTLASALPPPGYSKTRPHVWALSLPNGAVHLFQGGTAELVREWVSTANYWSARLSKEPLVGGVSNMEYGWSDAILDAASPDTASTFGPRASLQESIRSSIDHSSVPYVKARLPGDRANISDWQAPAQSMVASPLSEPEQLVALTTYVANIEAELQRHNELRTLMSGAFTPKHQNTQKALGNWEKKSSYLLHEIVKFRTYIDALSGANIARERLKEEQEGRDEMRRERESKVAAAAASADAGVV